MGARTLFQICIAFIMPLFGFSQNSNPFQSIGKQGKILTLSNGKYNESFEKDSLERVGSVVVNRHTRKIENLFADNSKTANHPGIEQSRFLSVDPLGHKFPELSPYQYASNRPIDGKDLDGLEWQSTGKFFNSVTGKYEIDYKVTLSLNNDQNLLRLANDRAQLATYQNTADQVFSKLDAKGTEEDPIISANVIFTDQKGPFNAQFFIQTATITDQKDLPAKDKKFVFAGNTVNPGNSQVNTVEIPIATQYNFKLDDGHIIHAPVRALDDKSIARSFSHELGHTAGLLHVFPASINIPFNEQSPFDLSTYLQALLPEGNPNIVFNNLLNSPANPNQSLNPDNQGKPQGTQLTPEQRRRIEETVQKQQPQSSQSQSNQQ